MAGPASAAWPETGHARVGPAGGAAHPGPGAALPGAGGAAGGADFGGGRGAGGRPLHAAASRRHRRHALPGRGAGAGDAHAGAGIRAGGAGGLGRRLLAGLCGASGVGAGAGPADRHQPAGAVGDPGGPGRADRSADAAGFRAAVAGAAAPRAAGQGAAARRRSPARAWRGRLCLGGRRPGFAHLVVCRRRAPGRGGGRRFPGSLRRVRAGGLAGRAGAGAAAPRRGRPAGLALCAGRRGAAPGGHHHAGVRAGSA